MNKKVSKKIMKRSRLRNKSLDTKSDIDKNPAINNVTTLPVF